MSLIGCATNGLVADSGCLWTETIWLHPDDQLTDGTLRSVVGHNEARETICGAPTE